MTSPASSTQEEPPQPPLPVNIRASRYPNCIVWTPIPFLTWLLPFIGHVGIADCEGLIHDFAAPFHVSVGAMAFGEPTKYHQLHPARARTEPWDDAVRRGADLYGTRRHDMLRDNCHSHAAYTLNEMTYDGENWNAWKIGWTMATKGRYTGFSGWLKTNGPAIVVWSIVAALIAISCR